MSSLPTHEPLLVSCKLDRKRRPCTGILLGIGIPPWRNKGLLNLLSRQRQSSQWETRTDQPMRLPHSSANERPRYFPPPPVYSNGLVCNSLPTSAFLYKSRHLCLVPAVGVFWFATRSFLVNPSFAGKIRGRFNFKANSVAPPCCFQMLVSGIHASLSGTVAIRGNIHLRGSTLRRLLCCKITPRFLYHSWYYPPA